MLDIKFIRENTELIKMAAQKKRVSVDIGKLISLDDERISLQQQIDEIRTKQNMVSKRIPELFDESEKAELIKSIAVHKDDLKNFENKLREVMIDWRAIMLQVPNIPDMSVPDGLSDDDNQEIKTSGEKPTFDFEIKDHVKIMEDLDMVDFNRGIKVSGFRGYFMKNDGAVLFFALWRYFLDYFISKGYTPMIVPSLVRKESLIGTGMIPQSEDDLYKVGDGQYLAGTSEVATMGYYMNEILDKKDLPKKFISFSPCFRAEAGKHGKDIKGIIRVHEFFKLEQVILTEASHEESVKWHEEITNHVEYLMQQLQIPYRVVVNCGGDLGLGQVKKYDIEAWVPSQEKYRETHSSSYFHDFQTRRLNIRYRDEEGVLRFTHSLNNTACATSRLPAALVENFQQADGSIKIPEVLVPYFGKTEIRK